MTLAMVKSHAKLLRKYLADNAKVSAIIDIGMYMQLELHSLKRQEQNFMNVLQLIKEAFFEHGDESIPKTCIKVLSSATNERHGDLQDSGNQVIKEESEDDYSLTANVRRLYQLQLAVNISDNHLGSSMTIGTWRMRMRITYVNGEVLPLQQSEIMLMDCWIAYEYRFSVDSRRPSSICSWDVDTHIIDRFRADLLPSTQSASIQEPSVPEATE